MTFAVLLLVPPQQPKTRTARVTLVALACVVTAVVATAVVGLRWHYFTDYVADAVGIGTVLALALLLGLALAAIGRTGELSDESAARPQQVGPAGGR